jgi:hypothetical protein
MTTYILGLFGQAAQLLGTRRLLGKAHMVRRSSSAVVTG